MTKPTNNEAILYAFAVEANHDRPTLEHYLRQYPDLAEELIDLSSELRLSDELGPSTVSAMTDTSWEAAWEELLTCKPRDVGSKGTVDPFAQFRGPAFVSLAVALNLPRSFLSAFRDGLVIASSIPERFVQRFAKATSSSVESAREYFTKPQPPSVARAFKSDGKPSHQGQKSFLELVQNTEMTDEQRQILLEDCSDDGLD